DPRPVAVQGHHRRARLCCRQTHDGNRFALHVDPGGVFFSLAASIS
ncbi:unnamed protein product, partial [Urochloa humidicola]